MSKLARSLTLATMLAAMNLAGMTAAAHATQASDRPTRQDARRPPTESRVAAHQQATADATVQRLLARDRSYSTSGYGDSSAPAPAAPGGQADRLSPADTVLSCGVVPGGMTKLPPARARPASQWPSVTPADPVSSTGSGCG
jgi:hypothetical protein